MKMSEHRYDIRISESCVDPNRLMVERQDPGNFPRLQMRERCALEIVAYVFNAIQPFIQLGLGYKTFFVLNSTEHKILTALKKLKYGKTKKLL